MVKTYLVPHDRTSRSFAGPWVQFCHCPKCPLNGDYIAAVEQTCSKLSQAEADECRVEVKNVYKNNPLDPHQQGRVEGNERVERF